MSVRGKKTLKVSLPVTAGSGKVKLVVVYTPKGGVAKSLTKHLTIGSTARGSNLFELSEQIRPAPAARAVSPPPPPPRVSGPRPRPEQRRALQSAAR